MAIVDLTFPSGDTVYLLRQWLQARRFVPSGADAMFRQESYVIESNIVQLTANVLAHGTAYYGRNRISRSVWLLAQKLNAGNRFELTPPFLEALETGEPAFARAYGVASESTLRR